MRYNFNLDQVNDQYISVEGSATFDMSMSEEEWNNRADDSYPEIIRDSIKIETCKIEFPRLLPLGQQKGWRDALPEEIEYLKKQDEFIEELMRAWTEY